ncbi:sugar porter family MFS transporter [Haloferula sargassicola]|uniref:D-xylose-proton symporter n=1 Tax=Haloferula sargassicola TaxID=490096 RepID=A0ABP9URQ4_9BACT
MSRLLLTSALASSIGSFLFGFDTAVIAGTTSSLREVFSLSESQLGFAVSSALFGAVAGAAAVGKPCERFGRVKTLLVLAVLYLVSVLGCAAAWDLSSLMVFRFIGGLAVGGSSVVSPMYITEITPPARRGLLVAVSQLNIVAGILAALVSNYLIAGWIGLAPEAAAWRWMFGAEALPAVLFLLTVLPIPESPRWLAHRGRHDEALATLKRLGHPDAEGEVARIRASFEVGRTTRESLFQRRYLKPLLLVFALAAFNQLDGINAILYYITDIFRMAGFAETDAFKQSAVIGAVNLVFTLLGMALIDRIGRRPLLLIGSATFILSHCLAAWVFLTGSGGWLAVLAAAGIVGSHAYSQGAVIWVCINELLPNAIRATGSSAACFVLWGLAILVSTAFPVVISTWGGCVFLIFGVMMAIQFLVVLVFMPEPKGRSLEEIEGALGS